MLRNGSSSRRDVILARTSLLLLPFRYAAAMLYNSNNRMQLGGDFYSGARGSGQVVLAQAWATTAIVQRAPRTPPRCRRNGSSRQVLKFRGNLPCPCTWNVRQPYRRFRSNLGVSTWPTSGTNTGGTQSQSLTARKSTWTSPLASGANLSTLTDTHSG